jgi:hypothetical protein
MPVLYLAAATSYPFMTRPAAERTGAEAAFGICDAKCLAAAPTKGISYRQIRQANEFNCSFSATEMLGSKVARGASAYRLPVCAGPLFQACDP